MWKRIYDILGYFHFLITRKKTLRNLNLAVDHVKLGLFKILVHQLEKEYERERAGRISAIIINKLFFTSSEEDQAEYSDEIDKIFRKAIKDFSQNDNTRNLISNAIRINLIAFPKSKRNLNADLPIAFSEVGWIWPPQDPNPGEFIKKAIEFRENMNILKTQT